MNATINFLYSEFDSPDLPGSGKNIKPELLKRLQNARTIYAAPMKINSGYRTAAHNNAVSGSPFSSHMKGLAVDIQCRTSRERFLMLDCLITAGFSRIGIYPTFIHVDVDTTKPQLVIWFK